MIWCNVQGLSHFESELRGGAVQKISSKKSTLCIYVIYVQCTSYFIYIIIQYLQNITWVLTPFTPPPQPASLAHSPPSQISTVPIKQLISNNKSQILELYNHTSEMVKVPFSDKHHKGQEGKGD